MHVAGVASPIASGTELEMLVVKEISELGHPWHVDKMESRVNALSYALDEVQASLKHEIHDKASTLVQAVTISRSLDQQVHQILAQIHQTQTKIHQLSNHVIKQGLQVARKQIHQKNKIRTLEKIKQIQTLNALLTLAIRLKNPLDSILLLNQIIIKSNPLKSLNPVKKILQTTQNQLANLHSTLQTTLMVTLTPSNLDSKKLLNTLKSLILSKKHLKEHKSKHTICLATEIARYVSESVVLSIRKALDALSTVKVSSPKSAGLRELCRRVPEKKLPQAINAVCHAAWEGLAKFITLIAWTTIAQNENGRKTIENNENRSAQDVIASLTESDMDDSAFNSALDLVIASGPFSESESSPSFDRDFQSLRADLLSKGRPALWQRLVQNLALVTSSLLAKMHHMSVSLPAPPSSDGGNGAISMISSPLGFEDVMTILSALQCMIDEGDAFLRCVPFVVVVPGSSQEGEVSGSNPDVVTLCSFYGLSVEAEQPVTLCLYPSFSSPNSTSLCSAIVQNVREWLGNYQLEMRRELMEAFLGDLNMERIPIRKGYFLGSKTSEFVGARLAKRGKFFMNLTSGGNLPLNAMFKVRGQVEIELGSLLGDSDNGGVSMNVVSPFVSQSSSLASRGLAALYLGVSSLDEGVGGWIEDCISRDDSVLGVFTACTWFGCGIIEKLLSFSVAMPVLCFEIAEYTQKVVYFAFFYCIVTFASHLYPSLVHNIHPGRGEGGGDMVALKMRHAGVQVEYHELMMAMNDILNSVGKNNDIKFPSNHLANQPPSVQYVTQRLTAAVAVKYLYGQWKNLAPLFEIIAGHQGTVAEYLEKSSRGGGVDLVISSLGARLKERVVGVFKEHEGAFSDDEQFMKFIAHACAIDIVGSSFEMVVEPLLGVEWSEVGVDNEKEKLKPVAESIEHYDVNYLDFWRRRLNLAGSIPDEVTFQVGSLMARIAMKHTIEAISVIDIVNRIINSPNHHGGDLTSSNGAIPHFLFTIAGISRKISEIFAKHVWLLKNKKQEIENDEDREMYIKNAEALVPWSVHTGQFLEIIVTGENLLNWVKIESGALEMPFRVLQSIIRKNDSRRIELDNFCKKWLHNACDVQTGLCKITNFTQARNLAKQIVSQEKPKRNNNNKNNNNTKYY